MQHCPVQLSMEGRHLPQISGMQVVLPAGAHGRAFDCCRVGIAADYRANSMHDCQAVGYDVQQDQKGSVLPKHLLLGLMCMHYSM